jgi:hypothetical protein
MTWWQFLLGWFTLSAITAPLIGRFLRTRSPESVAEGAERYLAALETST